MKIGLFFFLCALIALPVISHAESPTERVEESLRVLYDAARNTAIGQKKRAQISNALGYAVDFTELTKRAIGSTRWHELKKDEQDELVKLLSAKLEVFPQKYIHHLAELRHELGLLDLKDDEAKVRVKFVWVKNDVEASVLEVRLYRLSEDKERWGVYDVVMPVMGSIVELYQVQFARMFKKGSFDLLIEELKKGAS